MSRPVHDPQGHNTKPVVVTPPPNLLVQDVPPCPAHLNEVGQQVWVDVWAAGGDAYNVRTDRYVIERYAAMQERRADLMKTLSTGMVTVGSQGQEVIRPESRILMDTEAKLVALEDRLGLNPESRLRLGISAVEHESQLDAWRKKNNKKT